MVGGGEAGDPVGGGVEQHGVAGLGGLDAQADREVGLADPGRAEQDHVLGLGDERAGGQVREHVRRSEGRWSRLKSSRVLTAGKCAVRIRMMVPGGLAVGDLTFQHRGQVLLVRPVLVAGLVGEVLPDTRRSSGSSGPGSGRRACDPSLVGSRRVGLGGRVVVVVICAPWSSARFVAGRGRSRRRTGRRSRAGPAASTGVPVAVAAGRRRGVAAVVGEVAAQQLRRSRRGRGR